MNSRVLQAQNHFSSRRGSSWGYALALLTLLSACSAGPPESTDASDASENVWGSKQPLQNATANIDQMKGVAEIAVQRDNAGPVLRRCSGVKVSPGWILTASSCFDDVVDWSQPFPQMFPVMVSVTGWLESLHTYKKFCTTSSPSGSGCYAKPVFVYMYGSSAALIRNTYEEFGFGTASDYADMYTDTRLPVYPASLPASQRTLSIYGYGASGPYNAAALARKGALGLDYWSNDISLRGSPSQACYGDTGAPIVVPSDLPGSANKVVGILRDPSFYDKQPVCSASTTLHSATRIDMMIDWIRSTITQNSPNTCQDLVDSQGRTFTRCYNMPSCAPLTTSSWTGCQGSGCSACTSQLSQYPNYFRNHPNCTRNTACSGATSYCSANCPPPSNADKGCSNQIPFGRSSATASSTVNGNTAARAIDGYNTTRWESAAADPQWITVDLGQDRWVNKVILDWETASASYYEIELSTDGTTWTRGAIYPNSTKMNHRIDTLNVTPGVARYVRMRGTSRTTGWGYSLWDFAVYGDYNPQCNP